MLKFFLGSLYLTIFLFLMNKIEKEYLPKEEFKIKKIEFDGNYSLVKDELTKLSNLVYGKNMWELSLESIENQLKNDVRIQDADVGYKELGEIVVDIEEKIPFYYANIKDKTYAVGEKGEIFAFLDEVKVEEIPIIFVNEEKEIGEILKVLKKIKNEELRKMISQVYYKTPSEIQLLINKDTIIKTKLDVLEEKYDILRELYLNLSKEQKIEYIDLRFNDYIVKEIGADTIDKTKRNNKDGN